MEDKIIKKVKELIIPTKKVIDVNTAYSLSKYGQKLTEDEIYNRSITEINNLITIKSQNGNTSAIYEYDFTFPNMLDKLKNYLVDLGFLVIVIDNTIDSRIKIPRLFISWER